MTRKERIYIDILQSKQDESEINEILRKKECVKCNQCKELGTCVYEEDE